MAHDGSGHCLLGGEISKMSRPMRITHVIDSLARSGGSERQLLVNLERFTDPRLVHSLVVIRSGTDSRLEEVPRHVPVSVLFENEEASNRFTVALRLFQHFRSERPDLIHCVLPNASYACRVVGPLIRSPVVESLVNISHEPVRAIDNPNVTAFKLKVHAFVDRFTMRHFAAYHAVGRSVAQSWHRTVGLPLEKIRVIPRGVPAQLVDGSFGGLDESALSEIGVPKEAFVLLAVGRQEPQKGHRYIIEAMPSILADVPTAHLLIAGREGHSTGQLRGLIDRLGLDRRVHLLGSRTDVGSLLDRCDVFVFPSLFEGNGGNALIEAMAAGCSVVTTNAPPMSEVAIDSSMAILCKPRSPSSIAAATVALQRDPSLRADLGNAARKRIAEMLTPGEVARQTEVWYIEVLAL